MNNTYLLLTFVVFIMSIGCGIAPDEHGEIEHPAVVGYLKKADGKTPAAGALITMVPGDAIARVEGFNKEKNVTGIAKTDADGYYAFATCPPGLYTIEGTDDDGNGIRIDSVVVEQNSITDLEEKRLQVTGGIRGKVSLENAGDPSNVFVLVFGSDRFIQVGNDSCFLIAGLSYGTYHLKIVCVLSDCGTSKTVQVTVKPGDTTTVDAIMLDIEPICIPQNVQLLYDAERLLVNISWDLCTGAEVKGYYIYKYDSSVTDMFSARPDIFVEGSDVAGVADSNLINNTTYAYAVAAVSKSNHAGMKSSSVTVSTIRDLANSDTIQVASDSGWILHYNWTGANQLMVMSIESGIDRQYRYFVDVFSEELELMKHREINRFWTDIVKIAGDTIYWRMFNDSIVYCSSIDGTEFYHVNFHHLINSVQVYNDTFITVVNLAGSVGSRLEMYDQGGMLLYQDSAAGYLGGVTGGMYCMLVDYSLDRAGLYSIDLEHQTKEFLFTVPFQLIHGSIERMKTGFVGGNGACITRFDNTMQIVARFCQPSTLADNATKLQELIMNDNGRVVGILDRKSIVAFNLQ